MQKKDNLISNPIAKIEFKEDVKEKSVIKEEKSLLDNASISLNNNLISSQLFESMVQEDNSDGISLVDISIENQDSTSKKKSVATLSDEKEESEIEVLFNKNEDENIEEGALNTSILSNIIPQDVNQEIVILQVKEQHDDVIQEGNIQQEVIQEDGLVDQTNDETQLSIEQDEDEYLNDISLNVEEANNQDVEVSDLEESEDKVGEDELIRDIGLSDENLTEDIIEEPVEIINQNDDEQLDENESEELSAEVTLEEIKFEDNDQSAVQYIQIDDIEISNDMDLSVRAGISKDDFIELMDNLSVDYAGFFRENASIIYDLCEQYEINEIFFCGLIADESGWDIAQNHRDAHNYISMMKKDGGLIQFSSVEEGLEKAAILLHEKYLTEGGKYYHGKTIEDVRYCFNRNNPEWTSKVYACMKTILK